MIVLSAAKMFSKVVFSQATRILTRKDAPLANRITDETWVMNVDALVG